ncbi:hypothetical protein G9A89_007258 [Geosiphon pyriformis]|nr:hypothetical protein G9A89_007258 [Geosiphon pyriformis]
MRFDFSKVFKINETLRFANLKESLTRITVHSRRIQHIHSYTASGNSGSLNFDKLMTAESNENKVSSSKSRDRWTFEESNNLIEAYQQHGTNWKIISAKYFPQRTHCALKSKYLSLQKRPINLATFSEAKPGNKNENSKQKYRGWTEEEDEELFTLVQLYGKRWIKISHLFKTEKSHVQMCRRYCNYLDPAINKKRFTPDENQILLNAIQKVGEDWKYITKLLPGRSLRRIQTHYHNSYCFQKHLNPSSRTSTQEIVTS